MSTRPALSFPRARDLAAVRLALAEAGIPHEVGADDGTFADVVPDSAREYLALGATLLWFDGHGRYVGLLDAGGLDGRFDRGAAFEEA